jgi:RHS repeat-associated protein
VLASFAYDGFGRRAQKTVSGSALSYVYDREDILEERSAAATRRHVHGPDVDQPLATTAGGGAPQYFLADHLGSIVQMTDTVGAIALTRRYKPFGLPEAGGDESGYGFTGREWDAETSLQYHRARYYSPALVRFISADPAGLIDGPNLFRYSRNAPSRWVDLDGRNPIAGTLGGAKIGGGAGSLVGPGGTVVGAIIGGIIGGVATGLLASWLFSEDAEQTEANPKRNNPDQQAVIDLAQEAARKGGLTESEAQALLDLASQAGVPRRGPESHPNRNFKGPHIHVGPVNHLPVLPVCTAK